MRVFIKDLLLRVMNDNISFLAGGVAFYSLFALFPALTALVSLFGLITHPKALHRHLSEFAILFPPDVFDLLQKQLVQLAKQSDQTLSIAMIGAVIVSMLSATRSTKAMLAALHVIFRDTERRPWWRRQIVALSLTCGGLILVLCAAILLVALPTLSHYFSPQLQAVIVQPFIILRWILLAILFQGGLTLLYLYAPYRKKITVRNSIHAFLGAAFGTVLCIGFSFCLSFAAQFVPQLHTAYGSLSAIILLMLWMVLTAYGILFGAAITATCGDGAYKND
jgi:membrane protein